MKPLFCALALFTTMAPALAQDAATAKTPVLIPLGSAATKTADGLNITPVDVPASDVSKMLDIRIWRFLIQTPKPGLRLTTRLELRQTGKDALIVRENSATAERQQEFTLGLMPQEETLTTSAKLKMYTETRVIEGYTVNQMGQSGQSSLGPIPNPLLGLKLNGYSPGYGAIASDGAIELIKFSLRDGGQATLTLVLTTKPNAEDVAPKK